VNGDAGACGWDITALAYEPFVTDLRRIEASAETFIERGTAA